METEQAKPIGASLLESTQSKVPGHSISQAEGESLDGERREIFYPPSLLSTAVAEENGIDPPYDPRDGQGKSNRILLQGPTGSGRSSLAMDFAMEMASKARCLCNKDYSNCQCRPVVFLRANSKADSFPLSCHRHSQDLSPSEKVCVQERLQKLNQGGIESSSCSKAALRRISVHHFANLPDCLHYLLSIAGKPLSEQPFGAIIVDDIEYLVDNGGFPGGKDVAFQIMPLLAILLDTARFVAGNPSIVVAMNSNLYFPIDSWMASFFNVKITIQEGQLNFWSDKSEEENDLTVVSSWSAGVNLKCGGTQAGKEVEFIVGQSNDEERIVWRMKTTPMV